jgi:hypothetical protein
MKPTFITQDPLESAQPVCCIDNAPSDNLDKLISKVDEFAKEIRTTKLKEEKVWKIFNEKRPSKAPLPSDKVTKIINDVEEE